MRNAEKKRACPCSAPSPRPSPAGGEGEGGAALPRDVEAEGVSNCVTASAANASTTPATASGNLGSNDVSGFVTIGAIALAMPILTSAMLIVPGCRAESPMRPSRVKTGARNDDDMALQTAVAAISSTGWPSCAIHGSASKASDDSNATAINAGPTRPSVRCNRSAYTPAAQSEMANTA